MYQQAILYEDIHKWEWDVTAAVSLSHEFNVEIPKSDDPKQVPNYTLFIDQPNDEITYYVCRFVQTK